MGSYIEQRAHLLVLLYKCEYSYAGTHKRCMPVQLRDLCLCLIMTIPIHVLLIVSTLQSLLINPRVIYTKMRTCAFLPMSPHAFRRVLLCLRIRVVELYLFVKGQKLYFCRVEDRWQVFL